MYSNDERRLKLACLFLTHAMREPNAKARRYHKPLRVLLAEKYHQEPVTIFWRKWGRTLGMELIGPHSIQQLVLPLTPLPCRPKPLEVAINDTRDRNVVFVEGPYSNDDYLLFGLEAAARAGATSVGVLTQRLHFSEKRQNTIADLVNWMWVGGDCTLKPRTEHGAAKITPFPYWRSYSTYVGMGMGAPPSALAA